MKFLKNNENGYILIFVVIITPILILIGLTTHSISKDVYGMNTISSVCKKNFYIAEALNEEAEIKLYENIKIYLDNSYEIILKYIIENNYNQDMSIEKIEKKFKVIFINNLNNIKNEIEDKDKYNLKIIEKYNIDVKVAFEENMKTNDYEISITSIYKDRNIIERIRTKYKVKLPEYSDFEHNKNLIEKIHWKNYKW